ncbi:MAG TPA: lipid-binding SYLF domain-containing protein [Blastocatellia bacterium]|nr:lipid-binding SYLF domain-containing protein [Blastocatellia bacterium]
MKRKMMLAVTLVLVTSVTVWADKKEEIERAQKAARAFQEIMVAPDQAIPQDLLDHAHCVAVFPSVKKGGFVVGGQFGRGLISCRKTGSGWSAPAYFTIGGGSFGLQIGAQAVDLVLLVMNEAGVEGILKSKFEIGAGAAAAAGPVGRNASASTDATMRAQILSYSRSRGVFAGLELKGSVLNEDEDANKDVYGRAVTARELLEAGKVKPPADVRVFSATLTKFSARKVNGNTKANVRKKR